MIEDGEEMPILHSIDELKANTEHAGSFADAALVTVLPIDLPSRAVRVTITMEESLLKRLNTAAENKGFTRSGFIAEAVRQQLRGS